MAVFFIHGLLFASWAAHIPEVKAHLGLSDGALGFDLLGAPLGSVSAMLVAVRLLPRLGSMAVVRIGLLGYCVAGPVIGLAGQRWALFGALFGWGAFQGVLDVAMNTQAVAVERRARRPSMSGFHACWSIGAFAGAAVGTLGVALGVSLSDQLLLLGVPCLVVVGRLTIHMVPDVGSTAAAGAAVADPAGARRSWPRRRVRVSQAAIVLGAVAFASMLCEGVSADWASVYLRGPLHTGAATAGLGYTAFSLTMVMVRLSGNRLLARFTPRTALPVLAVVATIGFVAGLLGHTGTTVIVGFGCLGVGLGLIVPSVFSAAGRLPGRNPGATIATVSAFGWAGFVCGPPLIGQLASATSLGAALAVVPVLTIFIVASTALAPVFRRGHAGDPTVVA
jgi:MFS family permease